MLSQFFWAQWMKPGRQDWTEAVRQDLADFGMSADPKLLKKYSKYSFKKVVKDKATESVSYTHLTLPTNREV